MELHNQLTMVYPLQTFKKRLNTTNLKPRANIFSISVLTTLATILSFNQSSFAKNTSFVCVNNTSARIQHNNIPVISGAFWRFAASGYTSEQSCEEASNIPTQTFQKKSKSQQLTQANLKNWAWVYSVMEKVIRANGLDEHTWRVRVVNQYIDNASASDVNLVTIYDGLLDKINGDDAALAFIIGHELAHNSQSHLAVAATVNAEVLQRLNDEADREIQKLIADEQKKFQEQRNVISGVEVACGILPSLCQKVPIKNVAYVFLNSQGQPDPNRIAQKKRQIIAQKQQEFNQQQIQLGRSQETEADELGYLYMVKAGYDPQGALRVMNILARIPVEDPGNSVHPTATQRIQALKNLIRNRSSQALAAEGAARLRQTKPLTYAASSDGQSLLINSRFGSK